MISFAEKHLWGNLHMILILSNVVRIIGSSASVKKGSRGVTVAEHQYKYSKGTQSSEYAVC